MGIRGEGGGLRKPWTAPLVLIRDYICTLFARYVHQLD